jgi:methionine--tRNA ligase beta chain
MSEVISFEDFKKVDLRIAKIKTAELVEGSEKLLKLSIDLGGEERQVVSGISKFYDPETLIGKSVVVVANLEPRTMMGLESQAMLLAASGENGPVLLVPDGEVDSGTEIK